MDPRLSPQAFVPLVPLLMFVPPLLVPPLLVPPLVPPLMPLGAAQIRW
jgi:hypothetical protein